jgi:hypothetical protein
MAACTNSACWRRSVNLNRRPDLGRAEVLGYGPTIIISGSHTGPSGTSHSCSTRFTRSRGSLRLMACRARRRLLVKGRVGERRHEEP